METLAKKLELIDGHVAHAVATVTADRGASPVLVAVVQELERKLRKVSGALPEASESNARELIVEVEQAGDSAKIAALADPGVAPATRDAIVLAHDALCLVKFETPR
jgi:hypothetical protein